MADDTNTQDRPLVTRAQAKAAGLRHYNKGRTCPRGHLPVFRFVGSGSCLACCRERAAEYYAANPEKMRKIKRQWAKANPEKTRKAEEDYIKANPEKVRARHKTYSAARVEEGKAYRVRTKDRAAARSIAYRQAYPEKHRALQANRNAKKRLAGGKFTDADIAKMLKRQRGKCAHVWCGKPLSAGYHVDHIIPLALGGSNHPRNLQALCPRCNRSKSDQHPIDFAQRNGLLL